MIFTMAPYSFEANVFFRPASVANFVCITENNVKGGPCAMQAGSIMSGVENYSQV